MCLSYSPNGPVTSSAEVAVSGFLLLDIPLGRSKNLRFTSGGMVMGSRPMRDRCAWPEENERKEIEGKRNDGISRVRLASSTSRRSEGWIPVQAIISRSWRFLIPSPSTVVRMVCNEIGAGAPGRCPEALSLIGIALELLRTASQRHRYRVIEFVAGGLIWRSTRTDVMELGESG